MSLQELMSVISENPSSLFYGAGITASCGGLNWGRLLDDLKKKFPSEELDPFKYMDEIIGFDNKNRSEVEEFIRDRLAAISPTEDQKYLFSIPWRAVLTTNYDHLPEIISQTIDESRQILPISSPDDQVNRRVDRLFCFKLLGDSKYSYPHGGWMVLSESDLFSASERRTQFFSEFRNLAEVGHIVYLGYSFADDLVLKLLNQMKTVIGKFPWKGYAVLPTEPTEKIKKKLESVGITYVEADLKEFIEAAKKVFSDKPKSAPIQLSCLTIHGRTIDVDHSVLSNIHGKFALMDNGSLRAETQTISDFLRGNSQSFYPYVFQWDFPRNTQCDWRNPKSTANVPDRLLDLKARITDEELTHNGFVALLGGAGSGKTVVANRLAFEWYSSGNPVIFINSDSTDIDTPALDDLMNEIRTKYLNKVDALTSRPLRWLILADDCGGILGGLSSLRNHLKSQGKPADIVLISRGTEVSEENLRNTDIDGIYKISDTVSFSEREAFVKYLQKYKILDEELARRNLEDREVNSSLFALMYSCVRNSNENIKNLLKDEFEKLDTESKKVYSLVSLIQSYRINSLISILTKGGSVNYDWLESQAVKGALSGVLKFVNYHTSLVTFNRIIAERICEIAFPTSSDRKAALSRLISVVTNGDYDEMKFLDNLLNYKIEFDIGPRISLDHKMALFQEGIKRVKSKPLLIHLGRIQTNLQRFDDARKSLAEAHSAKIPGFDEIDEHVFDAEARLEFALAEFIQHKDKPKALEYLEKAEETFLRAKINPKMTPHPYEGMAKVYLLKGKLVVEKEMRWAFILRAMLECNYVENYIGEDTDISLVKMEIEGQLEQVGFTENDVERITDTIGKATAYAYIAEHYIHKKEYEKALECVEKGLLIDFQNIWLMRLRINLLRALQPDNHDEILNTLDDYEAQKNGKYDIELSFELAKETYMAGRIREARTLFKELSFKSAHHPRRLIPREKDRWTQQGKAVRLTGTLVELPADDRRYGSVYTTYPLAYKDRVVVRAQDIKTLNPYVGQRMTYEIIFNMLGPEASRLRCL
jgi:tetratricopeptide (TPR) repeat protein